jgi:diguanylate cyclase (GGDEF)-like protein
MAQQFDIHAAEHRVLALAIVDFDHFKKINDRFSHLSGDAVLRVAADLLRNACRERDLAIRYGGDEFVVVFSDTTAAQAETICERICTQISNHPWESIGPGLAVTATIGVADSFGVTSITDLMQTADQRLYAAKQAGRNRVA